MIIREQMKLLNKLSNIIAILTITQVCYIMGIEAKIFDKPRHFPLDIFNNDIVLGLMIMTWFIVKAIEEREV